MLVSKNGRTVSEHWV